MDPLPEGLLTIGRQPQSVQRLGLEVHVRPALRREEAKGAGHQVKGHELEVLVRQKQLREPTGTGEGQVLAARPIAEAIVNAFAIEPPAAVAAVEGVIGSSAAIEREDTNPDRKDALEIAARLTVFTNGDVYEASP